MPCLILLGFFSNAQNQKFNPALSQQIDSLKDVDQNSMKIKNADSAAKEYQKTIKSNFPLVKKIAAVYGFPGFDLVGKESSHNFWLLVQHSDFDVSFQKKMLKKMKKQVGKTNASGQDYAYLIDRVNLNEGKKQIYGTQVLMGERGTRLQPCVDSINLNSRRLSVGLVPIEAYLRQCDEIFYELNKDRIQIPKASMDSLLQKLPSVAY